MKPPSEFEYVLGEALDQRRTADQYRRRIVVDPITPTHLRIDGRDYVNFSSNNYLGLTHHPAVMRAVSDATLRHGAGAGAAGLISGHTTTHASAEAALARWKQTESAIILPSGYQANHAIIQTLAAIGAQHAGGMRFLIDKLSHASLIDAVRGSEILWRVYPHNGYAKLERLLRDADPGQLQVVVTESIFSMDGDAADLSALAELKQSHPFFLVLDEAHGSGLFGANGSGYAAEMGLADLPDASVVTLSKAMGVAGGAICGSMKFCDAVINFARASIFSTSISPGAAAGIEAAINVVQAEPARRQRVRALAARVREALGAINAPVDSPIIPILFGAESLALAAAEDLKKVGILVVAVRPPTVARGTSRLRITVSCEHTDAEVERLVLEIKKGRRNL